MPSSDPQLAPHPPPPSDLRTRPLPLLMHDRHWWRCHQTAYGAIHFGRRGNRFDRKDGPFGVLYAGQDAHCAIVETLGHNIDFATVTMTDLARYSLAELAPIRPLLLVNITEGRTLRPLGADARLSAAEYEPARAWAAALYDHPDHPDGIYYLSRHDPMRVCLALFERAHNAITQVGDVALLDPAFATTLNTILDDYGLEVIAS